VNIVDHDGFQYMKKSSNKYGEHRWTCYKSTKVGCKAVVKTIGDFIIARRYGHTCTNENM